MKLLKQCSHGGCHVLIPFNETYCEKHTKKRINKPHTNTRSEFVNKIHQSNRWKKLSKQYRLKNPICEICLKECQDPKSNRFGDIPRLASSVDHIKPLFLGGEPYNESNLQSLCNECHAKKSHAERDNL